MPAHSLATPSGNAARVRRQYSRTTFGLALALVLATALALAARTAFEAPGEASIPGAEQPMRSIVEYAPFRYDRGVSPDPASNGRRVEVEYVPFRYERGVSPDPTE